MKLKEHIAAGKNLQAAYLKTLRLNTILINTYGRRNAAAKETRRAMRQIMAAKSAADDLFFFEFPDAQHSPYFGDHYSD